MLVACIQTVYNSVALPAAGDAPLGLLALELCLMITSPVHAHLWQLITSISTIVLPITEIILIDTLTIATVSASPGTSLNLAHEWQQCLTAGQLPIL